MRYSGWALLLFGAGLMLGLVVVSADLAGLARIASVWMFAGIALLPLGLATDWWSHRPWRRPARKPPRGPKRPRAKWSAQPSAGRQSRKRIR